MKTKFKVFAILMAVLAFLSFPMFAFSSTKTSDGNAHYQKLNVSAYRGCCG